MGTVWIGAIIVILIFVFRLSGQRRQTGPQTGSERQASAECVNRSGQDKEGNLASLTIAHKKALVSLNAVELMSGITEDPGGNCRKA
jgi:hypothetical protein